MAFLLVRQWGYPGRLLRDKCLISTINKSLLECLSGSIASLVAHFFGLFHPA